MQNSLKHITDTIAKNPHKHKRAIFAVSTLGLGHATRSLPVILYYLEQQYDIMLISDGNALSFLKTELSSYKKQIDFVTLKDYPPLERGEGGQFYLYLIQDSLTLGTTIQKERKFMKSLEKKYDFIFSDGRYGIYLKHTPSYLLSHQISFVIPKWLELLQSSVNAVNSYYFNKFTQIFIPDFQNFSDSLAGKLSHTSILEKISHSYIGPLSSYQKQDLPEDIDFYCIISGYLLTQKESFIKKLIEQSKLLPGKKVFILGNAQSQEVEYISEYDITLYQSAPPELRQELFSRAKCIISRAGYTTIMDIVSQEKKAILFPTKNQTEQEYLAEFLNGKFGISCANESHFDLPKLISQI